MRTAESNESFAIATASKSWFVSAESYRYAMQFRAPTRLWHSYLNAKGNFNIALRAIASHISGP